MSSSLLALAFAAAAALSLGASAVLVVRLERLGARLGLSGAVLGMVAALAADAPEVTSAVTALAHGQHDIGTGVVLGSNVFNLAALIGLGAVIAGGIRLHRRVVVFEGAVALWIAAVSIAAAAGLITPVTALMLALAVLGPYVYVSAAHPSGRASLPIPERLRSWLAEAVAEEEQELAGAIHTEKGGRPDAVIAILSLVVVLAASVAMERSAATLGARYAVPGIITGGIVLAAVTSLPNAVAAVFLARRGRASATLSEAFNSNTINVLAGLLIPAVVIASPGLGGGLRIAIWYGVLTAVTVALALAGRGINRRSGALIIFAYLVFAVTVVADVSGGPRRRSNQPAGVVTGRCRARRAGWIGQVLPVATQPRTLANASSVESELARTAHAAPSTMTSATAATCRAVANEGLASCGQMSGASAAPFRKNTGEGMRRTRLPAWWHGRDT
jgi:cation:H+ antiporter